MTTTTPLKLKNNHLLTMDSYFAALLMGLMGAGHCVAMCGSLSMAVGFSIPATKSFINYSVLISIGRVLGYVIIAVIAHLLSQSVFKITGGNILYLQFVAALLMLGVGLHIAGLNSWVLKTEKLGVLVQRFVTPIKQKVMPINSVARCLIYGLLWGLLPCGMVYTALAMSMVAESTLSAALIMFCFGIGTLPTLVGLTAFNSKLNGIFSKTSVRFALGVIVILLAINQFVAAYQKVQVLV